MPENHENDPICGDCEMPRSQHFHEGETWYCNQITNGDVFTSEPSDSTLLAWMREEMPTAVRIATEMWKREHGHRG